MRKIKDLSAISILLSSFFYTCSSPLVQEKTDNKVSINNYHTYQWVAQAEADQLRLHSPHIDYITGTAQVVRNPDLEDRLRGLIERDLQKQGYRPVLNENPDFYVTYYGRAKDEDWVSSWTGLTPSVNDVPVVIFPNFERSLARDYRDGYVYVTMYDADTKKAAWTGIVDSSKFESVMSSPKLDVAIDQIVEKFKQTS